MTAESNNLAYKFEVADEIQLYRPRPVKRYMVCPSGGYYIKLEQLADGAIIAVFKGGMALSGCGVICNLPFLVIAARVGHPRAPSRR